MSETRVEMTGPSSAPTVGAVVAAPAPSAGQAAHVVISGPEAEAEEAEIEL